MTHGDHADHLERDEGLAQGGAADAETCGEVSLGRQTVTLAETVVDDPRGDLLGDLLVEASPLEGLRELDRRIRHETSLLTDGSLSYWLGH